MNFIAEHAWLVAAGLAVAYLVGYEVWFRATGKGGYRIG